MRYPLTASLVLLIILIAGCATSHSGQEDGASEEKINFDTGLNVADLRFQNNSLFDPVSFKFRVLAQCNGPDCIPDEAQLEFFVVPGQTRVVLYDLSLTINAGEEKYQWLGPDLNYIGGGTSAVGLVKSVPLDKKMLHQIAENINLLGNFAGQEFEWSYENREPIRKLLADMRFTEAEN